MGTFKSCVSGEFEVSVIDSGCQRWINSSSNILDTDKGYYASFDKPSSWIGLSFEGIMIRPVSYLITTISSTKLKCGLLNWVFEGKRDDTEWEMIDEHRNECEMLYPELSILFYCDCDVFYTSFRIRQCGTNANGSHILAISHFDVNGFVL